ncbi:MAG: hypothetical protein Kow0090_16230 [Myxococcota bacterium]
MLLLVVSDFSFAATELSPLMMEEMSDEKLKERMSALEAEAERAEKEKHRLEMMWQQNPTQIFAERSRRERILEELEIKIEDLDQQISAIENELSIRKQTREDEQRRKKQLEEWKRRKEKTEKKKGLEEIEDWDPETKAKLKALEEAEAIRRAKLEEQLEKEATERRRNNLIIAALLLLASAGMIAFLVKKILR